jgi:hypothetical protein
VEEKMSFKIVIDPTHPQAKTLERYQMIADVLEDFAARGHLLTIRQVFYQLVAQGKLANTDKNYANIIRWGTEARERGYVDWDALEDRIRKVNIPYFDLNLLDAVSSLRRMYRLDRQEGQEYHFEVWAEKDAVTQILEPMARERNIPYQCGHGQFTLPVFRAAMLRFEADPRPVHIFYFGDHDPTGILSIEENIRTKFSLLCPDHEIEVERVAVPLRTLPSSPLHKQLLPCPLKEKDVMTPQYRELYGDKSWELEALSLEALQQMLQNCFESPLGSYYDSEAYLKIREQEEKDKVKLAVFEAQLEEDDDE